jgi:hypothetical protein
MADKLFDSLLAEQTRQADRLIEMLDKIPDLLPTFTPQQKIAYEELEERRRQWIETRDEGLRVIAGLSDETEYILRRLALLEKDAETLRQFANAYAGIIRNEIPKSPNT